MLRERMPHVNFDTFDADRDVNKVADLITVKAIVDFIVRITIGEFEIEKITLNNHRWNGQLKNRIFDRILKRTRQRNRDAVEFLFMHPPAYFPGKITTSMHHRKRCYVRTDFENTIVHSLLPAYATDHGDESFAGHDDAADQQDDRQ